MKKMTMKKKVLGIFLAAVMFAASVTGCGGSKDGEVVSFTTTDLDGNTYTSEDLFKDHTVTMVNIWGTFCGPCIEEMPDLATLSKDFEAKGYGLIGIISDGAEESDAAKKIIAETGADYLHVIANEDISAQLPASAVPCTYFIDSKGTVIGSPVMGSSTDNITRYTEAIEAAAAKVQ